MQDFELGAVHDFFRQFKLALKRREKNVSPHNAFHQRQVEVRA
jgi:hypothetical protein